MKFSRNPASGMMEEYTDDGVFVGHVVTMGDLIPKEQSAQDGGPGSGNHGHAGRPGQVGGSGPGGGGGTGPITEVNKEFSGMAVRIANGIAKKAEKHPKVYDDWASSLTADEARAIEDQYKETHKPDADGNYSENISEYYERIWRMLAANAKETNHENKPVDGKDLSGTYDWNEVSYTEPEFGQVIDTQIEDILVRQGFNGVPKIVSKEEMDKILEENPDAPIMLRTFSAPDQKTLEQYNSDLEKGAWYVDCGIGGSKYGQGMYTAAALPWNPEDMLTTEDSRIFDDASQGRVVVDRITGNYYQLEEWALASPHRMKALEDNQIAILHNNSPDFTATLRKDGDKYIETLTGSEYTTYDIESFDEMVVGTELSKEEMGRRDISRPLGQMMDYAGMNERRILRNSPAGDAYLHRLWDLEDKAKPSHGSFSPDEGLPEYVSIPAKENSSEERYFGISRDGEDATQEKIDSLKPGIYMATYPGRGLHEGKNRMCLFRVNEDGTKQPEGPGYEFENRMGFVVSRGGKIYSCEDVTPVKPVPNTSTRKMTLDKSAKMVPYERLEDMYENYKDTHADGVKKDECVKEISKEEGFSKEQETSLYWFITYNEMEGGVPPSVQLSDDWKQRIEDIGGRDKARKILETYYDKFSRKKVRLIEDIGAFAAASGYDAIVCSNYGRTIVVLNRTKLIISDEKVEVPRREAS